MKRFVAKLMKISFGPTGCDLFRAADRRKRRALRKLCKRKWKAMQAAERDKRKTDAEKFAAEAKDLP